MCIFIRAKPSVLQFRQLMSRVSVVGFLHSGEYIKLDDSIWKAEMLVVTTGNGK
jgi:hypothetical protein